jgi:hypothetical protein
MMCVVMLECRCAQNYIDNQMKMLENKQDCVSYHRVEQLYVGFLRPYSQILDKTEKSFFQGKTLLLIWPLCNYRSKKNVL